MSGETDFKIRIASLSPEQRRLLQQRLMEKAAARAGVAANAADSRPFGSIPRQARQAGTNQFPLSFAQRRLWFVDQFNPGTSTFNVPFAVRVHGPLDHENVRQALAVINARHESLRTVFPSIDGAPVQLIEAPSAPELRVVDFCDTPLELRECAVMRIVTEEARRPFDLSKGPLFRATLAVLGPDDHVLLLAMHHIISDGWSMEVLFRELGSSYAALASGSLPNLPELPVQYADFAVWQQASEQSEAFTAHLDYWRSRLQGIPELLELPTDFPRPAVAGSEGRVEFKVLGAEFYDELKQFAVREGLTVYMVMLAAVQILLHRYTGAEDIMVGSPIAGRNRGELEGLVGCFVNTVAIRADLSGNRSARQVMHAVRDASLDAQAHQDLPFDKLVEELHPERSLGHHPIFQATFVLQTSSVTLDFAGLQVEPLEVNSGSAKFDLHLTAIPQSNGLRVGITYRTDLFEAATIRRMLGNFEVLLESVVRKPAERIADLPLLTADERQQLLQEFNATYTDYPRDASVGSLLDEQARRTPNAIAVTFGGESLTYAELNRKANQLARFLKERGIGPECLVGVATDRSLQSIIAVVGVVKSGAAYVPLGATHPADRLGFMVADTEAALILTQHHLIDKLPATSAEIIAVDSHWPRIAAYSDENFESTANGDSLLYVMYTSGSTGRPKGVSIPHRGAVRLVKNTNFKTFTSDEVFLQLAPISFDAATLEIWGPLLNGGRLVVMPPGIPTLEDIAENLKRHKVTTLWITSGLFNQMVDSHIEELACVNEVFSGGDVLSVAHVRKFLAAKRGKGRFVNGYGPTENTTFTACYEVSDSDPLLGTVPIGRPLANTRIYVLDAQRHLVPVGVVGELYTGGDGLARGYFKAPELTAERFVPDPFSVDGTGKLYRTGDLVRWLPSGNLEFVGRRDGQVKLRGFRIELSEIEAVLATHDAVTQCAVVVRKEGDDKRLIAYLVSNRGATVRREEIRAFLGERLPGYMVPSAFVEVSEFPLDPNGKIDRKALPAPDAASFVSESQSVAPRNPIEELLAAIWCELLRVERVSVHDSFWDMGGHSLLATQLVSRIRQAFGTELPIRALFEAPTVAELAQRVADSVRQTQQAPVPPLKPASRELPLPLSFAQQRLWFIHRMNPGDTAYNVPSVIRLKGPLDIAALERSVNCVIARHEVLRTTFSSIEDEPVQVIAPELKVAVPVIDLSAIANERREAEGHRLADAEVEVPFDLSTGPLVRFKLLKLAELDHVLVITMHHIVSDGWSIGIMLREISAAYQAFAGSSEPQLHPLPIQYADYAVWQRECMRRGLLDEQVAYWREQLVGTSQPLALPTDRPRPSVQSFAGAKEMVVIPADLLALVRSFSRAQGATLFMTLMATFQLLLARYSGEMDLVVGTDMANRTRVEAEQLIGFFINVLPIRARLRGNPTFREFVAQVRESALAAYAHQEVPLDRIVEELRLERSSAYNPLIQVLFVQQNTPRQPLNLPGVEASPFGVKIARSKFDVAVFMTETGETLTGSWFFSTDLFDAATIRRMAAHYEVLLRNAVTQPDGRANALEYLTETEKKQRETEQAQRRQAKASKFKSVGVKPLPIDFQNGKTEAASVDRKERRGAASGSED